MKTVIRLMLGLTLISGGLVSRAGWGEDGVVIGQITRIYGNGQQDKIEVNLVPDSPSALLGGFRQCDDSQDMNDANPGMTFYLFPSNSQFKTISAILLVGASMQKKVGLHVTTLDGKSQPVCTVENGYTIFK